ncbi:MAG: tRNA 2-thiouridine(34) synthase MnmA [Candidatus Hydrogenedentota bacterium]
MHPPKDARILVAMSGGVDSAVTAALLAEAGYDCYGVTMRLVPEHPGKSVFEPCCGIEATQDARRVCERLGIPHETVHAVDRFSRDIIAHFTAEYAAGRTPNPCVRCNRMIKFGALYQHADKLGADYIAMGHYARLVTYEGRVALRRAAYRPKDQSYVLAPLTQPQLRRACFPLGDLTKDNVRTHAQKLDFRTANKPESQEICFVPDNNYRSFLDQHLGTPRPGPIMTLAGEVVGEHTGLTHYTPGQRKGLGLSADRPYYVVRLDTARNTVLVAHAEATPCTAFDTSRLCWGGLARQEEPFECLVQLRSHHTPVPATVSPIRAGARVALHTPQRAITPGQWAVMYDTGGHVLASAPVRDFTLAHEESRF